MYTMAEKLSEKNMTLFERFSEYVSIHGYFGTLTNLLWFLIAGTIIYFAINPDVMFARYDKYTESKHNASTEYRIENAPKVKFYLNQMAKELNADKAFIMEYHNGKSNPSGLQWQYCDMTFLNDEAEDVTDEYQNVSLVRYTFANELYANCFYSGSIDELESHDKRLALRLSSNDVKYVSSMMLYGENLCGIGFLGVSYKEDPSISRCDMQRILTKYTNAIAPLLDGARAEKKK